MSNINLQLALSSDIEEYWQPSESDFQHWTNLFTKYVELPFLNDAAEVSIHISNQQQSQQLNHDYRSRDKPTNVLSFPYADEPDLLGDLIMCAQVIDNEAQQQNKTRQAHWTHMTLHGLLHLAGYDHQTDQQAEIMEGLEIQLLNKLSLPNPYIDDS